MSTRTDYNQSCTHDRQCGGWAECVALEPQGLKQCWCVHDLEKPDRVTGRCRSPGSGPHADSKKTGVLLPQHLADILNVTSDQSVNQSSSSLFMLRDGSSTGRDWPLILPVTLGSLMVVLVMVIAGLLYRRRLLLKQYGAIRTGDGFVRNTDSVQLLDRMNVVNKNPTYFRPESRNTPARYDVLQVPSSNLKLSDLLGEGAFGQVFRGELVTLENSTCQQVAVKILKNGATQEAQENFEKEVALMAIFDHDNILKLLGVVAQGPEGGPYMIFEYMEHGDLSELLRRNDPNFRSNKDQVILLNKADLVDVSMQVASGMSYLAGQRFVHRDLATRNCLVGGHLTVKISDFGMSRDVYTSDYYRIGGSRLLPVRWMSPEALRYGCFTIESDIWAYGVLLWEIFSFGKQPYYGHTNEEVINFLERGILLSRPEDCPSIVYHLMLACWKRDPADRISFDRLNKHLSECRHRLVKPLQSSPQQPHLSHPQPRPESQHSDNLESPHGQSPAPLECERPTQVDGKVAYSEVCVVSSGSFSSLEQGGTSEGITYISVVATESDPMVDTGDSSKTEVHAEDLVQNK